MLDTEHKVHRRTGEYRLFDRQKPEFFLENRNREFVHLLNGSQVESEAQDAHSSRRM